MNFGDIMTFKELMKITSFELAEIVIHYKDGKIQTMIVDHIPNSMGFFFKDFEVISISNPPGFRPINIEIKEVERA